MCELELELINFNLAESKDCEAEVLEVEDKRLCGRIRPVNCE